MDPASFELIPQLRQGLGWFSFCQPAMATLCTAQRFRQTVLLSRIPGVEACCRFPINVLLCRLKQFLRHRRCYSAQPIYVRIGFCLCGLRPQIPYNFF